MQARWHIMCSCIQELIQLLLQHVDPLASLRRHSQHTHSLVVRFAISHTCAGMDMSRHRSNADLLFERAACAPLQQLRRDCAAIDKVSFVQHNNAGPAQNGGVILLNLMPQVTQLLEDVAFEPCTANVFVS